MAVKLFVAYRQAVDTENAQRIADHQAAVAATAAANPLNLLADGDSGSTIPWAAAFRASIPTLLPSCEHNCRMR